jgi:hypothetical protein
MSMTEALDTGVLHRFQRRVARQTFTLFVVAGLILFAMGYEPVARGLVLGSLFSVLNFMLMAHLLPYQVGYKRRGATMFAGLSILVRMGMMAVPLVVALKYEAFHWIAAAVGLFAIPVGIFIDQWIAQRLFPERMDQ